MTGATKFDAGFAVWARLSQSALTVSETDSYILASVRVNSGGIPPSLCLDAHLAGAAQCGGMEDAMQSLSNRVHSIVGTHLGVATDTLVSEANLLDDLGADSLDVVELVMAIEEEFGIEVPDEDVENIRTIGDIVSYLGKREIRA